MKPGKKVLRDVSDWIYSKNKDNSARYTLGIEGKSIMLCFGINPSTAEPNNLDNTLKSVERIAQRHNFEGWIMFNIYPQRATNPNDLHEEVDKTLHATNLKNIKAILKSYSGNIKVLAAWGTLIQKRKYLKECLKDIHALFAVYDHEWVRIGNQSIQGHPHHPLYLSNAEMLKPFAIIDYIKSLS